MKKTEETVLPSKSKPKSPAIGWDLTSKSKRKSPEIGWDLTSGLPLLHLNFILQCLMPPEAIGVPHRRQSINIELEKFNKFSNMLGVMMLVYGSQTQDLDIPAHIRTEVVKLCTGDETLDKSDLLHSHILNADLDAMFMFTEVQANYPGKRSGALDIVIETADVHAGYMMLHLKGENAEYKSAGSVTAGFMQAIHKNDMYLCGSDIMQTCSNLMKSFTDPMPINFTLTGPSIASTGIGALMDAVLCISCPDWPRDASEWLTRSRKAGWPSQQIIDTVSSVNCEWEDILQPILDDMQQRTLTLADFNAAKRDVQQRLDNMKSQLGSNRTWHNLAMQTKDEHIIPVAEYYHHNMKRASERTVSKIWRDKACDLYKSAHHTNMKAKVAYMKLLIDSNDIDEAISELVSIRSTLNMCLANPGYLDMSERNKFMFCSPVQTIEDINIRAEATCIPPCMVHIPCEIYAFYLMIQLYVDNPSKVDPDIDVAVLVKECEAMCHLQHKVIKNGTKSLDSLLYGMQLPVLSYTMLGYIYMMLKDYSKALEAFKDALALDIKPAPWSVRLRYLVNHARGLPIEEAVRLYECMTSTFADMPGMDRIASRLLVLTWTQQLQQLARTLSPKDAKYIREIVQKINEDNSEDMTEIAVELACLYSRMCDMSADVEEGERWERIYSDVGEGERWERIYSRVDCDISLPLPLAMETDVEEPVWIIDKHNAEVLTGEEMSDDDVVMLNRSMKEAFDYVYGSDNEKKSILEILHYNDDDGL